MNSSSLAAANVGYIRAATMKNLDQIALSAADRKAIEAAADILRRQFPVSRVTLFGSKARGEDHPEADIDLLALTSRPLSVPEKSRAIALLLDLELAMTVVISVLFVPEEDWLHGLYQVLPIRTEIDRDGVAA